MEFSVDLPDWQTLEKASVGLSDETPRLWGTMSPGQMLAHVNGFCELYLGELAVPWPIRMIARLIGRRFLARVASKSPSATPRNMNTLPSLKQTSGAPKQLEEERKRFLLHCQRFAEMEANGGTVQHQMYGEMAAEDIAGLVRHHTAHHFHQFGLI